jgi:hypothetical protein
MILLQELNTAISNFGGDSNECKQARNNLVKYMRKRWSLPSAR